MISLPVDAVVGIAITEIGFFFNFGNPINFIDGPLLLYKTAIPLVKSNVLPPPIPTKQSIFLFFFILFISMSNCSYEGSVLKFMNFFF